MAKTLSTIETQVRILTGETDGDAGLFSTEAGLIDIINTQYFMLFAEIAEINPDLFAVPTADLTLTSAGIDTKSSALFASGVHYVNGVDFKDNNDYFIVDPVNRREGKTGWYIQDGVLYMFPKLSNSITIRMWIVAPPAALVGTTPGTTDVPFGGRLGIFHDLIGYGAALAAMDKDEVPGALVRTYDKMHTTLINYVRAIQTALPRQILDVNRSNILEDIF